MHASLATLRQTPQLTPAKFLTAQPGCWIQYYDDTPAKDPAKALSARSFDLHVARRKQSERCAVCFSLQAFGESRTKEGFLSYRNLGVDVDLVPAPERRTLSISEIDQRKGEYLESCLLPFLLKPHWLVETGHGFHAIFRVMPQRVEEGVREAATLNRRLVIALRGDENAVLLTQVLRVPGTYQFKNPERPFLCRLLMDNADGIPPYGLDTVRRVLDARKAQDNDGADPPPMPVRTGPGPGQPPWQAGLAGVTEGTRNVMAACLVGGILCRLPEALWETGGWGGLKEWNGRLAVPLPERELRTVFESIARRERAGRHRNSRETGEKARTSIESARKTKPSTSDGSGAAPRTCSASFPCQPC